MNYDQNSKDWSRRLNREAAAEPSGTAAEEHPSCGRPTSEHHLSRAEQRTSPCTDPGSIVPRSAKPESRSRSRARPYRANREASPRGRAAQLTYRGRSRHPTRKASSHVRPNPSTNIIRPAEPDERTRKLSAMIDPTVPIAGRTSRPTVRTVRST
ncbi:unnamed protein product [Microthlaspi erraticum]|uniref:Uncharacterized protein n=1 Tax=Microthlaspi erraticum TaxID=1685480 RepID=A0A6D2I0Q6_9BRAS|nr:unnamed protein product [Microthlaspi erraticum]